MQKKPEISLIICTHNRSSILAESFRFYEKLATDVAYEILIVINACSDDTIDVVKKLQEKNDKIRYVIEETIGHSNARNTGWKNAEAPFVFYIDDDAYPESNLIDHLQTYLTANDIHCISGTTKYWDKNSPSWITASFVEVETFRQDFGLLPKGGYINGCACGFSTESLKKSGGFNPNTGMKGEALGYFDEVYVQERLHKLGYKIYYSPTLVVHHQSHNKTVKQFLMAAYSKGKSRKKFKYVGILNSLMGFMLTFTGAIFKTIGSSLKMPFKAAVVTHFSLPFVYLGQLFG